MKRVQRVEDSLAQVWGRAAPNVLPAESMAKLIGLRKSALTPRRRLRNPAFLRPLVTPSGSPQRNAQARSEPNKSDNRTALENALTAIPTHGGIETQDAASRLSFPDEGKETGVIRRKTPQQKRKTGVIERKAPRQNRSAPPPDPRAHKRSCRSYNRPNAASRRRTIHYPMKRNSASPR